MKKVIGGKTYVEAPELTKYGCVGCAAKSFDGSIGPLCRALGNGCSLNGTIWKEQTMSEQNKTAVELVETLKYACNETWVSGLNQLKSAIERERDAMMADIQRLQVAIGQNQAEFDRAIQEMNDRLKSAITMRPISELPGKAPDGCAVFAFNDIGGWLFSKDANPQKISPLNGTTFTHFYVLPLPKPEHRLHPCYMPGCGGSVTSINGVEKTDWRMMCTKCGMLGPIFNTKAKAELEWGYVE